MNIERPNDWVNYGDVNPQKHGGLFVRWTNGEWHIIETNGCYFSHYYMDPTDVWENGEPLNGFTDWAAERLQEYSHGPFHLDNVNNPDLPEGEAFEDYMAWIVDNHLEWVIGSLALSFSAWYSPHSNDSVEDYWTYLEKFGIEQENF